MAYKRRYNPKDDEAKLENDRKSRVQELESYSFNHDFGDVDADIPTAGNKTENKDTEFTSEFKDMPNMFIDGKINPAYDSSAFQDALAGIGIGVRSVGNGNPFATIGAAFGGLAGGLVTKNIKGRMDYNRDVQDTIKYNEALEFKTQANIRAEQLALNKKKENRIAEYQANTIAIRQQVQDMKDYASKLKFLNDRLDIEEDESLRQIYAQELEKLTGLPQNPNTRGRVTKKLGDFVYNITKGGGVEIVTDSEGTPLMIQDTDQYLDMIKNIQAIENKQGTTPEEWTKYINMAKASIEEAKLPVNPKTYSAQVINLAREFQKTGGKSGWINLDGVKRMLKGIDPAKPFETNKPQASESQSMPNDGLTPPPFVDATVPEANRPNSASEILEKYDPKAQSEYRGDSKKDFENFVKNRLTEVGKKELENTLNNLKVGSTEKFTILVDGVPRKAYIKKNADKNYSVRIQ